MTYSARLFNRTSGFTMIELLMAAAILGILATFALLTFPSAQITARDTRRKSDTRQYSASLESFANRSNGLYPSYNADIVVGSDNNQLCSALGAGSTCPFDPKDPQAGFRYHYVSNGTGGGSASATKYVLYSGLEKQVGGANWLWVICSSGQVGRAAIGTNFAGANCPASLIQ